MMSDVTVMAIVVPTCSNSSSSGSSFGTATMSSAQAPAPTSGMPLKLRVFAADVRWFDRSPCPKGDAADRVTPRRFGESLVAYATMSFGSCGPSAATQGVEAQMPLDYGARSVGQPCLRWR